MIISKTPVRISFFGGGTDIENFYSLSYGAVLSTAMRKYIFILVNKKFDDDIRASYSVTEITDSVDKLKHEIIREALKFKGITGKIEIVTVADIPGHGTGLGSSSTLTVGLLNALNTYQEKFEDNMKIAEDACRIEIEILKRPIGKQDQYIAALGGLRYIKFYSDGRTTSELVNVSNKTLKELEGNLVSFYIPGIRDENEILSEQKKNITNRVSILEEMRNQADEGRSILRNGDLTSFGQMLDKAWQFKSMLSSKISNGTIEKYYHRGIKAGALGGKLSGAGASGFLTFYCEPEHQKNLRENMSDLKEMDIELEPEGTRIIYYSNGR